jgi:gliding motility-associated-like protein
VKQGPTANFNFSPEQPNSFLNQVQFQDMSIFTTNWRWAFGAKGYSTERNPMFTFRDTGIQKVKLTVTNQNNCVDSMIKYIDIEPKVIYHLPNAFSANQDALNDTYKGKGYMEGATNFTLRIWNRWGELVFESADPDDGWNGRKFNTGREEPQGVYVCVVQFTGPRGVRQEITGFATLLR